MLDRLLVSLGSAAIGGALVYFAWSVLTRRLAGWRGARSRRGAADDDRPDPPTHPGDLAEIRGSLADLARAQVTIMERLDTPPDTRPKAGEGAEALAPRIEAMAAMLESLADRAGPEAALADAMGALDGRLAAIEDRLVAFDPGDDGDDDKDAAMAAAMAALADRLEGVETGLASVLRHAEAARAPAPDAATQAAALRDALAEAVAGLETRLAEELENLSARLEDDPGGTDDADTEALSRRLDAIGERLQSDADQRIAAQKDLSERLSALQTQLESPAEVAFADDALAELDSRLQATLDRGEAEAAQTAAVADSLAALDTRLDAVQRRLDALASDRSSGRTLELLGALSTLQTDTARLKGGIEKGLAEIRDTAAASAERIAGIDSRLARLETGDAGAIAEALAALARRLEEMARADLPASVSDALQAELPALAGSVAAVLADRLATGHPASGPAAAASPTAPAGTSAPVTPTENAAGEEYPRLAAQVPASVAPPLSTPFRAAEEPSAVSAAMMARTRAAAEMARAEAALLRARPGLATVIGRHAQRKPNGGDV